MAELYQEFQLVYACPKCARKFAILDALKTHLEFGHSYRPAQYSYSKDPMSHDDMNSPYNERVQYPSLNKYPFPPAASGYYLFPPDHSNKTKPKYHKNTQRRSASSHGLREHINRFPERRKLYHQQQQSKSHSDDLHSHVFNTSTVPGKTKSTDNSISRNVTDNNNSDDEISQSNDVVDSPSKRRLRRSQENLIESSHLSAECLLVLQKLRAELSLRDKDLMKTSAVMNTLVKEKNSLDIEVGTLKQQVEKNITLLQTLREEVVIRDKTLALMNEELEKKDNELLKKKSSLKYMETYVKGTAQTETLAKERLRHYVDCLVDRAQLAECELKYLKEQQHHALLHSASPISTLHRNKNENPHHMSSTPIGDPVLNSLAVNKQPQPSSPLSSRRTRDSGVSSMTTGPFNNTPGVDGYYHQPTPPIPTTPTKHMSLRERLIMHPPFPRPVYPDPVTSPIQPQPVPVVRAFEHHDKYNELRNERLFYLAKPFSNYHGNENQHGGNENTDFPLDDGEIRSPQHSLFTFISPHSSMKRKNQNHTVTPSSRRQPHSPIAMRRNSIDDISLGESTFTTVTQQSDSGTDVAESNIKAEEVRLMAEIHKHTMRRRQALFCVFTYLNTKTLLEVASVCREWRAISRHPSLWKRIAITREQISSKFLKTLSGWCTETQHITLIELKGRSRKPTESSDDFRRNLRGSLEEGLEYLLRASAAHIHTLRIISCENVISDRALWLASSHCRSLRSITYLSRQDPISTEVTWALGAGCREITELRIRPQYPFVMPCPFNDRCLQMIGRCWPLLQVLTLGGPSITDTGLISIAKNCIRLQFLVIDHLFEMNDDLANVLCHHGLRALKVLRFMFTPVTTGALLEFNSSCIQLQLLSIHIGISEYFDDIEKQENIDSYKTTIKKFKVLKKHAAFAGILDLKTDYG